MNLMNDEKLTSMAFSSNFILLDAARMEHAIQKAIELNPENVSLYKGQPADAMADIAPYIFHVQEDNVAFQNWTINNGWRNAWGVFIEASVDLNAIHRHFRRFLLVKNEDGKQLYFRFYDPRVLRIFLPTCDTQQLKEFFGPVSTFVCEDEKPEFALVFSNENGKLITQRLPVSKIFANRNQLTESPKLILKEEDQLSEFSNRGAKNSPTDQQPEKPKIKYRFY